MNYIDDDDLTSISYLIRRLMEEGLMEAGDMHECILVGYSDCLGNASARPTMYIHSNKRKILDLPSMEQTGDNGSDGCSY